MNREQKIALIIGFAVILVVGVLVSDHWSRARQLQLADASEGDAGLVQGPPIAALPSPGVVQEPVLAGDEAPPPADGRPAQAPVQLPEVVAIDQRSGGTESPLGDVLGRAGSTENPARSESWLDRFQRVAQGIDLGIPAAAEVGEGRSTPVETIDAEGLRSLVTPAEPARPVRHTVAKNESLFAIAKRYYGDGSKWRRIAEANPGKVSKDGQVRQGVMLEIPGADGMAPERARQTPGEGPKAKPQASRPTTYTVQRNDSLSEISQRLLGSARRMGEIIAANRGKISDPDDIRVGMVLNIPSKP